MGMLRTSTWLKTGSQSCYSPARDSVVYSWCLPSYSVASSLMSVVGLHNWAGTGAELRRIRSLHFTKDAA